MIVTGNDEEGISELQRYLASEFEMKDRGELKYFLGIKVYRSKLDIFLSQRKYVLDLLVEIGMLDCKLVDTLIIQNHCLVEYLDQVSINRTISKIGGKTHLPFTYTS
jgi:hypothetical protein